MPHQDPPVRALAIFLLTIVACGGVESTDLSSEPASGEQLEPAETHAGLAPDRQASAAESFAGRVVLREALATGDGFVFTYITAKGSSSPHLMRKYSLSGPAVSAGPDASRVLTFTLDAGDNFAGTDLPPEIEFKALFDVDGLVDTKVDSVGKVIDVVHGQQDIEVVLSAAPAYNPLTDG